MVGLAGHLNAALLTTMPADRSRHRPESLSALLPDHLGIHTIRGGGVAPAGRAVTRFMGDALPDNFSTHPPHCDA
jgi:hypothetical protein